MVQHLNNEIYSIVGVFNTGNNLNPENVSLNGNIHPLYGTDEKES